MDYYKDQLKRIEVGRTEYAPTIKINANGNGTNTTHLDLNAESAKALIEWLQTNFLNVNAEEYWKDYANLYQFEEGSPEYLMDKEDFLNFAKNTKP